MANIKSQIKRNKQNDKRRLRNRVYRGTARIAVKHARSAIDAGVPESKAALISAISALDKAAEQDVIHKNNAARRKSRLMKAFAKMEPVVVEAQPAMVEPVAEAEEKKAARAGALPRRKLPPNLRLKQRRPRKRRLQRKPQPHPKRPARKRQPKDLKLCSRRRPRHRGKYPARGTAARAILDYAPSVRGLQKP